MAENKFRIRMKTRWTGKLDEKTQTVKAGEVVDVDMATAQALVFQHGIAELVPIEEIIKQAKTPKKKPAGQRAARTKAQETAPKDKMVKKAANK